MVFSSGSEAAAEACAGGATARRRDRVVRMPPPRFEGAMVGRDDDVARVADLVLTEPLVTVWGAGGVGKTRLTAAVAQQVSRVLPGRTAWVELAGASNTAQAVGDLMAAFGATASGAPDVVDALAALVVAPTLLVLDNAEHMIDAVRDLVGALRASIPQLRVMVTSREPLHLAGEIVWPAAPLDLAPASSGEVWSVAGTLFVERARRSRPTLALGLGDVETVEAICRWMDGVPLGIELAAAQCRYRSPEAILARLAADDGEPWPERPGERGDERHRTSMASVAWSYAMLDERDRRAFLALSVTAGPFPWELAESLVASDTIDGAAADRVLRSLVDRTLLHADVPSGLRVLEPIRRFARRRLAAEPPLERWAEDRHVSWWSAELQRIGAATPDIAAVDVCSRYAVDIRAALAAPSVVLDRRHELLASVALAWLWGGRNDDAMVFADRWLVDGSLVDGGTSWAAAFAASAPGMLAAVRLDAVRQVPAVFEHLRSMGRTAHLLPLLMLSGPDWRARSQAARLALDAAAGTGSSVMVAAYGAYAAALTSDDGEGTPIDRSTVEGARRSTAGTNRLLEALALDFECPASIRSDVRRALREPPCGQLFGYERGLVVALAVFDALCTGEPNLLDGAMVWAAQAEPGGALLAAARGWELAASSARSIVRGEGLGPVDRVVVERAAALAPCAARYPLARALLADGAADAARRVLTPDAGSIRAPEVVMAVVSAMHDRRWSDARVALDRAADLLGRRPVDLLLPDLLELGAVLDARRGAHRRSARLLGAAARQRDETGLRFRHRDLGGWVAEADHEGRRLDSGAWAREYGLGSEYSTTVALAYLSKVPAAAGSLGSLTAAERRVVELVAEGRTNPQIAAALGVGRTTVKSQVSAALAKLGLTTRSQLAATVAGESRSAEDQLRRPSPT